MRPRDHGEATKAVFNLTAVAAAVTGVSAVWAPETAHSSPLAVVGMLAVLALVVLASWLLRRAHGGNDVCWALFPLFTVVLVVALDLLTRDASITAQIFLFFPALYGASQLRRPGAIIVTAATVLADAAVVFSLLTPQLAFVNVIYMSAALVTSAMLLIKAGERNDALVAKLQRQAAVDPLTGLVTRRVLDSAARTALSGAASEQGTVLILLDVDRFKSVNDEYGHPAGDDVLVQLATIITKRCRPSDVVSRLGGDELALLLSGTPPHVGYERALELRADVAEHVFRLAEGQELRLSVSVGIAHAPTHALDLRALYSAADTALYDAKRGGRNRVAIMKEDAKLIAH